MTMAHASCATLLQVPPCSLQRPRARANPNARHAKQLRRREVSVQAIDAAIRAPVEEAQLVRLCLHA